MGEHIDNRKHAKKPKKLKESFDPQARAKRVTFKNYLRELEEELLEQDLDADADDDDDLFENKMLYVTESYWKADADEEGYSVKLISGNPANGDQAWEAYDGTGKKVGSFAKEEDGPSGWLILP